jgi:DNA-binding IclR family transcriptional regulator
VQEALAGAGQPLTAAELARRFQRARASTVEEILDALVSLGLAHKQRGGKYQA